MLYLQEKSANPGYSPGLNLHFLFPAKLFPVGVPMTTLVVIALYRGQNSLSVHTHIHHIMLYDFIINLSLTFSQAIMGTVLCKP